MAITEDKAHLPTLAEVTDAAKKREIRARLLEFDGNRNQAAKSLCISRQQLHYLVKKLNIPVPPPNRNRDKKWQTGK